MKALRKQFAYLPREFDAPVNNLLAALTKAEQRVEELEEVVYMALPALGGHARGFSQEALIRGCELVGSKPEDWTQHPETMKRRREALALNTEDVQADDSEGFVSEVGDG